MPVKKNKVGQADGGGGTFRVLAGYHEEPNADGDVIRYGPGETVESDKPLDVLFTNKFVREDGGKTKRPRDLTQELDDGGANKVMDKPAHKAANEEAGHEGAEQEDDDFVDAGNENANQEDGGPDVEAEQEANADEEAQPVKKAVKTVVKKAAAAKAPVNKKAK